MKYVLTFTNHLIELVWVLSLKQKVLCVSKWASLSAWNTKFSIRLYSWTPFLTICKNDVLQALSETGSYLYADNTCISYKYKYFEKADAALKKQFSSIYYGFCRN